MALRDCRTGAVSGLLGTGHHYLLDRHARLLAVGRHVFSTMEVLPFFAMVLFTFSMVWKGGRDHPNKAALLWRSAPP